MLLKLLVLFGSMFALMIIGAPMAVSLGVSTMVTMALTTSISLTTMATACFSGLDSFPLMAIPFFILAGNLMRSGGISRRILQFADALVGWITGSVGMVTVVASMFFAALSGSSPATVTAIGGITIPQMKEEGYDHAYATALAAASGTIGVIIPPSIPFVIYGVAAQCSISDLFLAGIIPGVLIGIVLMAVNYITTKKHHYGNKHKFSGKKLLKTLLDSFWALLVPVIILGGIYGGIFTPTEAAVVAIIYSLIIGVFVYKELNWKTIYEALRDTVLVNGQTTFLVGISMSFARFLTMSQVPTSLAKSILNINSPIAILLAINIFLLVVGCFIDMSPIQFGILMTVNLAIGFITPPYGCNLFFASAISNVSVTNIAKKIMPMIGVMLIVLMAITFIPGLTMGILGK